MFMTIPCGGEQVGLGGSHTKKRGAPNIVRLSSAKTYIMCEEPKGVKTSPRGC